MKQKKRIEGYGMVELDEEEKKGGEERRGR